MLSSKELHGWHRKRKIDLCGWASISGIEEVWLMQNADTQCKLEGRVEAQMGRELYA